MANRSKLINAKSQLLSDPENESIFNLLGRKCTTLATAVIQLYLAEEEVNRNTWNKHSCGVVCFVKDNPQKSYFFRLYDPKKQHMLWEQEIYNRFKYKAPRKFFHTFEAQVCQVGFNFASDDEASVFKTVVENKLMERLRYQNEKKNQPSRDGAQMFSTAANDNDNTGTAPRVLHTGPGQSSSGGNISPRKFSYKKKYTGKRKGKMKLKKTDISTPTQFQHVTHLGFDLTTGLDMLGEQAEVKEMLKAIGISDPSNEDEGTIKFIYDFVDTHGGINAVREDLARRQPPKHLPPHPATPPLTTPSPAIPPPILPVIRGTRTPPPVNDNKMNVPLQLQPMPRGTPNPRQSPVEHILTAHFPLQCSVGNALTTSFPLQSPADHALSTPFPHQSSAEHALTTPFPPKSSANHALTTPFLIQSSADHTLTTSFPLQSPVHHAVTKPFLRQSSADHAVTKPFLLQSSVDHVLTKPFLRQSSAEHALKTPCPLQSPVEHALTKPIVLQSPVDHALSKPILLQSPADHALTKPFPPQSPIEHGFTTPFPLHSSVDHALTTPSPPINKREYTGAPLVSSPRPPNRPRAHSTKGQAPSPPVMDTTSHKSPPSPLSVTPVAPPPPPMNMDGVEQPLTLPNYGMSGLHDSIHMGTKLNHVDPCQGVTSSDSRDGLLSQIRGGTTLKPVDYTDSQTPVQQPNDILGALAAALAQRKDAIQGSDAMDDNSDDADDEDDDDEWDD